MFNRSNVNPETPLHYLFLDFNPKSKYLEFKTNSCFPLPHSDYYSSNFISDLTKPYPSEFSRLLSQG